MKQYFAKYLPIETEMEEIHYCIPCNNLGGGIRHCAHPEECGNVITNNRAILKSGDVFFDKDLGICIKGKEEPWVEWKGGKTNLRITDEHKKVKLFLCSRDTQAGDKVFCLDVDFNNPLHPPERYIDPWRIKSAGDNCNACVKVIGQISPEAKWVKDGDTFNDDEVRWAWFPPYDEPEYYPLSEFTWKELVKQRGGYKTVPKYLPPIVAIKCPCCEDFK